MQTHVKLILDVRLSGFRYSFSLDHILYSFNAKRTRYAEKCFSTSLSHSSHVALWLVNEDQNSGFLNFLSYFLHAWECGDESGMRIAISHLTLLCSLPRILANVEKTIFLGPPFIPFPDTHPNLEDLHLDVLSPSHGTLRRQIAASFPTTLTAQGTETWLLVEGLDERQRYEIRICWAATVSDPRESHIYQHAPVLHVMFHVMSIYICLPAFCLPRYLATNILHPANF